MLRPFAWRRPFCEPRGGITLAESVTEVQALVNFAYGASEVEVLDPETMGIYKLGLGTSDGGVHEDTTEDEES